MLAGVQGGERLAGVVLDRRVDVNGVDLGVVQDLLEVGVSLGDLPAVAAFVEVFLRPSADRRDLGPRVRLVDRNKLSAKTEADDRDPGSVAHLP